MDKINELEDNLIDCPRCGKCDRSCDNCAYCGTDVGEPIGEWEVIRNEDGDEVEQ